MIPFTYMPSSHARALEPDRVLVEGMRGAGKSWWWRALADENHRKFVSEAFPEAGLNRKIEVKAGFGVPEPGKNDTFPDKDTLSKLATQFDPRQIWRTVLAQNIGFTQSAVLEDYFMLPDGDKRDVAIMILYLKKSVAQF